LNNRQGAQTANAEFINWKCTFCTLL